MYKRLATLGCGLMLTLWAGTVLADVVVVVSAQSPVEALTQAELEDIYLGRLTHFPNGARVIPLDRRESSVTYGEFYEEYLGRSSAQIKAHWSKLIFTGRGKPPRTVSTDATMADLVSKNLNAIGYIDAENVTDGLRIVPIE